MTLSRSAGAHLLGLTVATLSLLGDAGAAPLSLREIAQPLRIDETKVSVSGLSSGAFMAHQFQVAHSAKIMGAGLVAGGPFYCAEGSLWRAETVCSWFANDDCLRFLSIWPFDQFDVLCHVPYRGPQNDAEAVAMASKSFARAESDASAGVIDATRNIARARIYLFTGLNDQTVPLYVVAALDHFYRDSDKAGVASDDIVFDRFFPARHAMVTDNFYDVPDPYVGACNIEGPPPPTDPYIGDCRKEARRVQSEAGCGCRQEDRPCPPAEIVGKACTARPNEENLNLTMWPDRALCMTYVKDGMCGAAAAVDLAGAILKHIYAMGDAARRTSLLAPTDRPSQVPRRLDEKIKQFDQAGLIQDRFHQPADFWASFADSGSIYVPDSCARGEPCSLHVAFHACRQGGDGDAPFNFAKFAGYNEWAKENHIVVLYPRLKPMYATPYNPLGCWDFWGELYTGEKYATRGGRQIKALAYMINMLVHDDGFLVVPDD
jgi:hypothetical protein